MGKRFKQPRMASGVGSKGAVARRQICTTDGRHAIRLGWRDHFATLCYDQAGFIILSLLETACVFRVAGHLVADKGVSAAFWSWSPDPCSLSG